MAARISIPVASLGFGYWYFSREANMSFLGHMLRGGNSARQERLLEEADKRDEARRRLAAKHAAEQLEHRKREAVRRAVALEAERKISEENAKPQGLLTRGPFGFGRGN